MERIDVFDGDDLRTCDDGRRAREGRIRGMRKDGGH
jgi:hypothetical protein